MYQVIILLYGTRYFGGLYSTKKEALKAAKELNGFIEKYTE